MAKTIAVWGSPNSGKTTFATKLALSIYSEYQSTVIVLYCDYETPTLPVIFPNYKADNLFSVGVALSKTEITLEEVIKQIVTVKGKVNFGFLGFKDRENRYTYPQLDETKVRSLYNVLETLADFVIIDCTSGAGNTLTRVALSDADDVIRLATPDLKSISWYSSQLPLYADPRFRLDRQIQGINVPDADLFMPIDDAKAHLPDVRFTVPYSMAVKQQMLDGHLYEAVNDKKFNDKFKAIVEKVV